MAYPPVRGSGVKIDRISDDWMQWDLRLPMGIKTWNYLGTHFGGNLYASLDPHLMLAFIRILGPDYIVWDKAATIRFRKPGKGTLRSQIRISADEVDAIKRACDETWSIDRTYKLTWTNAAGEVVAEVEKVLYFRKKDAPA